METTICGISAMQYLLTPPLLRGVTLDADELCSPELEGGIGMPRNVVTQRNDNRDADRLIRGRLCGELKGVTLPVQAYVGQRQSRHVSRCVLPRTSDVERLRTHRVHLGNGLYVLTVEAALCTLATRLNVYTLAELIYEVCGIYSLLPNTRRLRFALAKLQADGSLAQELRPASGIYGFSDRHGKPISHVDAMGVSLPWSPVFDRHGVLTDMWKRPPLTSVENITYVANELGLGKRHPLRRALSIAMDGSGSPAETKALLLLCSGPWHGGESFGKPCLNRRVEFTSDAAALAHRSYCIADALWPERNSVLEVNGLAFHADRDGFRIASGRTAALESLGYSVAELTHEQMANLELFDAMLPSLSHKLGFPLQRRSAAFLRRRDQLHRSLFLGASRPTGRDMPL